MEILFANWKVSQCFLFCLIMTFLGLLFSFRITEIKYREKTCDCSRSQDQAPKRLSFPFVRQNEEPLNKNLSQKSDPLGLTSKMMIDQRTVRAKELMERIFKNYILPEANCNKKLLVYQCTHQAFCNGLGDRMRGIIASFALALLTNRTFCIDHCKPCLLENFLLPNVYNWSKCLPWQNSTNDTHYIDFMDGIGNMPNLSTALAGDIWKNKTVVIRTNCYLLPGILSNPHSKDTLPWLTTTKVWMIRHTLYHILFKLERYLHLHLETLVDILTLNRTRSLVGVHLRSKYFNINDTKFVFKFLGQYSNHSKHVIYLATDMEKIKKEAMDFFTNVHTLNTSGQMLHVDYTSATCESLRLAILEQQILARSDILIKTPSSFSQQATVIRGDRGITYNFHRPNQNANATPTFIISKDFDTILNSYVVHQV